MMVHTVALLVSALFWMAATHAPSEVAAPPTAAGGDETPAAEPPAPANDGEPAKADAENAGDAAIEQLLRDLEHAHRDIESFTADLRYENWEDLLGRREIRTGELFYRVDPGTRISSFAVIFDTLIVRQRRQSREKHYVFHDRWLAEIDHATKQFIKRELVPPGQQLNPLRLGEGPMPLPIGQRADEVLERFEVELIDVPEDGMLAGLADVDGVRLTPREGRPEAEDYAYIEIFYDHQTRLPVGINVIEPNDNRKTVRLLAVDLNPDLTEEQLAKMSVEAPDPEEGWSVDIRPLRR